MELVIFGRFHAIEGNEETVRATIAEVVPQTRAEPGCLDIRLFESTNFPGVFYIHSVWRDDAALDAHREFPHMKRFLALLDSLTSNQVKAIRTHQLA